MSEETCKTCNGKEYLNDSGGWFKCPNCKGLLGTFAKTDYGTQEIPKPELEKMVNALWHQVQQMVDLRRHDSERIEKLEQKTNVLDSTRINIADFDKLQEMSREAQSKLSLLKDHKDRIEKLEDTLAHKSLNTLQILDDQNKCLEKFNVKIAQAHEKCELMRERMNAHTGALLGLHSKAPHQCPICDGKGKVQQIIPMAGYFDAECHSCEGKGVLWG